MQLEHTVEKEEAVIEEITAYSEVVTQKRSKRQYKKLLKDVERKLKKVHKKVATFRETGKDVRSNYVSDSIDRIVDTYSLSEPQKAIVKQYVIDYESALSRFDRRYSDYHYYRDPTYGWSKGNTRLTAMGVGSVGAAIGASVGAYALVGGLGVLGGLTLAPLAAGYAIHRIFKGIIRRPFSKEIKYIRNDAIRDLKNNE